MKIIFCALTFFLFCWNLPADQIINRLDISNEVEAPKEVDLPIVVRNSKDGEWAVLWWEASTSATTIFGRIVKDDGTLGPVKKLTKGLKHGVQFDAAYDPEHNTYLLLFSSSSFQSLKAQAYQSTLKKKGAARDLTNLFQPLEVLYPKVLYDPDKKSFVAYFDATEFPCVSAPNACPQNLNVVNLDAQGKPTSPATLIVSYPGSQPILSSNVFRNPVTKNTLLMIKVLQSSGTSSLLAFVVKPDASLLKSAPLKVATNLGFVTPGAAFDPTGGGFLGWSKLLTDSTGRGLGQQIGFRRIKSTEKGLGGSKKLPNGQTSPTAEFEQRTFQAVAEFYDVSSDETVFVWHELGVVKVARIDAVTGKRTEEPFSLDSVKVDPNAGIDRMSVAVDPASGRAIAVWREIYTFSQVYQIRAVIFEK